MGTRYYWAKACNSIGCSEFSSIIEITALPATTLSAQVNGDSAVLNWADVSADHYEIYKSTDTDSSLAKKVASVSSGTSYSQTATASKIYYWVKSCNSSGCSNFSNMVSTQANVPQTVLLTAGDDDENISLSWNDTSADYYEIYRSTSIDTSTAQKVTSIHSSAGTGYREAVIVGIHYYWVKSCNSFGCSDFSNYILTEVNLPQAATLSAIVSGTMAVLNWSDDVSSDYYEIYRGISADRSLAQKIATVSATTSYQETALLGTRYYWVKVCSRIGCSDFSNAVTTQANLPQATTLSATISGANAVLSWIEDDTSADYYEIYRSADIEPLSAQKIASVSSGDSYQEIAVIGTSYYWIKSCNVFGCSDFSQELEVIVIQAPSLSATLIGVNAVLTWNDTSADYYEIYRGFGSDASSAQKRASHQASLGNSYQEVALIGSSNYWIKACNSIGCSDYSNLVSIQAIAPQKETVTASISGANVVLSWSGDVSADYYEIYRNTNIDTSTAQKVASPQNSEGNSYQEIAVIGTSYYWVKSCNVFGCLGFSNMITIHANLPQVTTLTVVINEANLTLSWRDTSADYYEIYRSDHVDSLSAQKVASSRASSGNSYQEITTLGTRYYWIKSCNNFGCSDFSPVVEAISLQEPTLTASIKSGSLDLSWNDTSANYYEIYRNYRMDQSSAQKVATVSVETNYHETAPIGTSYYWVRSCNSYGCSAFSQVIDITALPAPVLSATISDVNVILNWSDTSADYYQIYSGVSADTSIAQKINFPQYAAGTSYQEAASIGTRNYWVKSCNSDGCSAFSNMESIQANIPEQTKLFARVNGDQVELSWIDNSADHYEIYRISTNDLTQFYKVATVSNETSYKGTALVGISYYVVKSCNVFGCSSFSNIEQISVLQRPTVTARVVYGDTIILTWDDTSSDYYEIYKGVSPDLSSANQILTQQEQVYPRYGETAVVAGTSYFWIRGCNQGECSSFSDVVEVTVLEAPTLEVRVRSDNAVFAVLSWNNTSASYYEIYRSVGSDASTSYKIDTISTGTSYIDLGILGTTNYWIKSCNSIGCSPFSSKVQVTVLQPPVATARLDGSNITISWDILSADYYEVYRSSSDDTSTAQKIATVTTSGGQNYYESSISDTGYYWVKACNSYGCSAFSYTVDIVVLPVPTLTGNASKYNVSLSWNDTSATYYEIYRNTDSEVSSAQKIATVQGSEGTSYQETLAVSMAYYWVKSCSFRGCTEFSNIFQASFNDEVSSSPSLRLSMDRGKVVLNWLASSPAEYYIIYKNMDDNLASARQIVTVLASSTSYRESSVSETQSYYWIQSCNSDGCSRVSDSVSIAFFPLNDTGSTFAGSINRLGTDAEESVSSTNNYSCVSNIDASQDCDQGRDFTNNDDSDGYDGFSFTRINSDGSEHVGSDYTNDAWSCVRDNVTGLLWEVKTKDNGIHDKDKVYGWGGITAIGQDSTNRQGIYYDAAYDAINNTSYAWDVLVNGSNSANLCGYNDWRVPTRDELFSIFHIVEGIDSRYFPNNARSVNDPSIVYDVYRASSYFTASPYFDPNFYWYVVFYNGAYTTSHLALDDRSNSRLGVRLVRGERMTYENPTNDNSNLINNEWPDSRYIIHNDGTVTDVKTNLIWKRCPEGLEGDTCDTIIDNSNVIMNWEQALLAAKNSKFAGKEDWRVPNIKELASLVALDRLAPSINSNVFPNSITDILSNGEGYLYVASTPSNSEGSTIYIAFNFGRDLISVQSRTKVRYKVRLVRDRK